MADGFVMPSMAQLRRFGMAPARRVRVHDVVSNFARQFPPGRIDEPKPAADTAPLQRPELRAFRSVAELMIGLYLNETSSGRHDLTDIVLAYAVDARDFARPTRFLFTVTEIHPFNPESGYHEPSGAPLRGGTDGGISSIASFVLILCCDAVFTDQFTALGCALYLWSNQFPEVVADRIESNGALEYCSRSLQLLMAVPAFNRYYEQLIATGPKSNVEVLFRALPTLADRRAVYDALHGYVAAENRPFSDVYVVSTLPYYDEYDDPNAAAAAAADPDDSRSFLPGEGGGPMGMAKAAAMPGMATSSQPLARLWAPAAATPTAAMTASAMPASSAALQPKRASSKAPAAAGSWAAAAAGAAVAVPVSALLAPRASGAPVAPVASRSAPKSSKQSRK